MFAYRRKRSLGCEQLEGRFAPSSVLVGAGGRSTFKDAQALETMQAEQAASYLAASAVLSQSSSVVNVAPITFDQPAAGEAERSHDSDSGSFSFSGFPMICEPPEGWGAHIRLCILVVGDVPQPTDDGTGSDGQQADDSGVSRDVPSVDPISPETPSEQGNDADAVGAVPSEELPTGGDDVAAEDFPPVVDDTLLAGGQVADPVVVEPAIQQTVGSDDPTLVDTQPVSDSSPVNGDDESDQTAVDNIPPITDASGGIAVQAATCTDSDIDPPDVPA